MLYRFKSQAAADIIMLQSTGEQMLTIIGKPLATQGVITVAQMPAALTALAQAVAASEATPGDTQADTVDDDAPQTDTVRLRQRAAPLMAMLKECAAAGQDVVWGA